MRRIPALLGHGLILLAALRYSHSTSGFLLNGPAVALLVDRYLLRLLPWASPVRWRSELAARSAYFIVGAVVFYLLRPGIVPWWEAVYRGALASVAAFAVESCVGLVSRSPRGWRDGLWVRLTSLGLLILAIPEAAALHPLHTVPKRTPTALGLAFEEVRFRTADGLRLTGWLVPHVGARGNVIFCHGHGRNRGHVAALLPTLHAMGLNVLSFDFRGHGESEGHTSTFGCREVDDLLAAESYLRGRCPGRPLFLVGTSLGAAVAIQALPRMPGVRGVWSEGAFAQLDIPVANEFRALPRCLRLPLVAGYHWVAWLDCGIWMPAINPVDAVVRTHVPVYFCHGRMDELVPFSEAEALQAAHAGNELHWWVDNASHYNVRQRNSEEYLRRLRSFIEDRMSEAPAASEPPRLGWRSLTRMPRLVPSGPD